MSDTRGFETRQIHVGGEPDPTTGARAVPIYQTTSFQFRDAEHAQNLFALAEIGNIYTRIMNPTQGALEARLSSLEGGVTTAVGLPGALVVSSGQSAEMIAILTLAEVGDHIVTSPSLDGGRIGMAIQDHVDHRSQPGQAAAHIQPLDLEGQDDVVVGGAIDGKRQGAGSPCGGAAG